MQRRLKLVFLVYLLGNLVLITRFFYWQVVRQDDLRAMGESQYIGTIQQLTNRGVVYTKDGYPLVQNIDRYILVVDPQRLKKTTLELQTLLRPILGSEFTVEPFDFNSHWVSLAVRLSQEEKEAINGLKIDGLSFELVQSRYYPEASMSAHLVGFVGQDSKGQSKGYYGLEGYYDRELKSRNVAYNYLKDAVFRPIGFETKPNIASPGRSLITTIDRPLQFQLEKRLAEGINKYQAKSGFGVIINPLDGSVLALAAWPNYDPGKYWEYVPELYRNPVISSAFEPESIFKVLVMASALDEAVITDESICDLCQGPRVINDYLIKTWNDKYYPDSTMMDIIVHSDNVGMVYVAEKLGIKKFLSRYFLMGFNRETGIDLEGEATPPVRPENDWGAIDLATA